LFAPGTPNIVNRDSALFLVIGLLAGFLAGYIAQEEMSARQPQRVLPGVMQPGSPAGSVAESSPAGSGPAGAPMARIEALRQKLEANPDDPSALLELANLNFDIQNWGRARELYERLLALQPGDPDILTDLGICLRAQGSFDEALDRFRAAQKLAPDHWQSRFNEIVVLALDKNDLGAAETKLSELSAISPGNPDVARLGDEIRKRKSAG
jgi:uncharacterized protein HemY